MSNENMCFATFLALGQNHKYSLIVQKLIQFITSQMECGKCNNLYQFVKCIASIGFGWLKDIDQFLANYIQLINLINLKNTKKVLTVIDGNMYGHC